MADTHERPNRDLLCSLYHEQKLSLHAIGRQYGVSGALVRKWMLSYGIPTRSISEGTSLAQRGRALSPASRAALVENARRARAAITDESRRKQAESMRGKEPWNKGGTLSDEHRAKIAESWTRDPEATRVRRERMSGANSPHWKGGLRTELEKRLDTAEWRHLRVRIYERDDYTCQDCGRKCRNTRDSKNLGGAKIQCHHVVPRRDGGTDDPGNLVTLCMSCHHKRERKETPTMKETP